MKIEIDEKTPKETKPILFSELDIGDIFRHWSEGTYHYCLKTVPFDFDGAEYNYTDLEDGDYYFLDLSEAVEKYDDLLKLKADSFIAEK